MLSSNVRICQPQRSKTFLSSLRHQETFRINCTHSLGSSGSSTNSPFGFPRCFRNAVSNISLASYLGDHNSTFKVSALLFFFHAYFHITVLDSVGFNITNHYHDSSPPDAAPSSPVLQLQRMVGGRGGLTFTSHGSQPLFPMT